MKSRILIVVDTFPQVSETFILHHIITLMDAGYLVNVMANRMGGAPTHKLVIDYELFKNTLYRPKIPLNRAQRMLVFLKYLMKCIWISPSVAWESLNITRFGKDAINGNLAISLYSYLKMDKPDFIHCHFGTNAVMVQKILELLKWDTPLFISFHGYDSQVTNENIKMYKKAFNRVNHVFVNSQYLKSRVLNLNCPVQKISIIPVGILNWQVPPKSISKEPFIILTVGRLTKVKGIEYSLEALRLFLNEYPCFSFKYIIIGDGPLKEELLDKSRRLELTKYVEFTGALSRDEVSGYYSIASLFVLTGITLSDGLAETQGLVYQEAASFGLPLIASNAGGVPEYVHDRITGLIARERDIEDIKEKIRLLTFDPEMRNRMGNSAKQYSKENFDQSNLTRKMIEIYEHHRIL